MLCKKLIVALRTTLKFGDFGLVLQFKEHDISVPGCDSVLW
jgi:hypothetical protein